MYQADFYKDKTDKEVFDLLKEEGFNPILIEDPGGQIYHPHQHQETKLLAILDGMMEVDVNGVIYHCKKGDRIMIHGYTPHSAVVGGDGCRFYWSEKLV